MKSNQFYNISNMMILFMEVYFVCVESSIAFIYQMVSEAFSYIPFFFWKVKVL